MAARILTALGLGGFLLNETLTGAVSTRSPPSLVPHIWNGVQYGCKCYPGDTCWPTAQAWHALNTTVDGNLLVNHPPGAPCYNTFQSPLGNISTYDAEKCAALATKFGDEQWTTDQPAAALWTYFTNDTCRPTAIPTESCTLGYYPVYVVTAKTEDHVKAGVDFVRANNLRLIIRNTGHDFLGRSIGWGSFVINTHSFQSVDFHATWSGPGDYQGSAVTIGAGVQGRALLRQAHAETPPQAVVTGECPTVGVAGGLVQGGGHGPWTTLKGFAADTALRFSVLTAGGEKIVADASNNSDLFWALKGGGSSAYAVILSATFETMPDPPSAGMALYINATHTQNSTLFWEGFRLFHKYSNHFVENGLYVYYEVGDQFLSVRPFVAINQTAAALEKIVQPLFDELKAIGLPYETMTKEYNTFFDLFADLFEDEGAGISSLTGGWTFSQQDVQINNDGIIMAYQNAVRIGGFLVGHIWDAGHGLPENKWANSAVNPRFRRSSDSIISSVALSGAASLAEKTTAQYKLTYEIDQLLREAGPDGCAYVNEADPFQPNWQESFWGVNYPRLVEIKKKWDPNGLFYAVSTPGTEDWEQIDVGTRLCKKI